MNVTFINAVRIVAKLLLGLFGSEDQALTPFGLVFFFFSFPFVLEREKCL